MDELRSVNLSKFVSEAVTAICDAKLRSSDIQAAVQVCAFAVFTLFFSMSFKVFSSEARDPLISYGYCVNIVLSQFSVSSF